MKISVICSSRSHPIFPYLQRWTRENMDQQHEVMLVDSIDALSGGDILFLISCSEIVGQSVRSKYGASLVIHASDLPRGRGWSPHIWQILEGKNRIKVSLIEAEDKIDTGNIWSQAELILEGHELYDEINDMLFTIELSLMDYAVSNFRKPVCIRQNKSLSTYYRKRKPEDSRIDPDRPISEQFDLIRVSDPDRYPTFFDFRGKRYKLILIKHQEEKA